jgi:hypothetical protein
MGQDDRYICNRNIIVKGQGDEGMDSKAEVREHIYPQVPCEYYWGPRPKTNKNI